MCHLVSFNCGVSTGAAYARLHEKRWQQFTERRVYLRGRLRTEEIRVTTTVILLQLYTHVVHTNAQSHTLVPVQQNDVDTLTK